MSIVNGQTGAPVDVAGERAQWLDRLSALLQDAQSWAAEIGWSTRRIEKLLKGSELGTYSAPALLLQEETTRVLLDPIAHAAPGVEGVVDMYLMPAYDDIASLYLADGTWRLQYVYPGSLSEPAARLPRLFTKETFQEVLQEMKKHAAQAI